MSASARRTTALVTLGLVIGALVFLGVRFADDGVVYYRTPSEVAGLEPAEGPMRLSGLVSAGSVTRAEPESSFLLTDGAAELTVTYDGVLPASVREGEGAVVEGRLVKAGVFQADLVLLRHSNEYRPAADVP